MNVEARLNILSPDSTDSNTKIQHLLLFNFNVKNKRDNIRK